jgi:hypothetical protein
MGIEKHPEKLPEGLQQVARLLESLCLIRRRLILKGLNLINQYDI